MSDTEDDTDRPGVKPVGYEEAGYGDGKFLISAVELASGNVDGRDLAVDHAGDYIKVRIGDSSVLFEIEELVDVAFRFLED